MAKKQPSKNLSKKIYGLKWHITFIDDRKTYQNKKGDDYDEKWDRFPPEF